MRALSAADRAILAGETSAVRSELSRVDTKAACLVGLDGAGLVFAATAAAATNSTTQGFLLVVAALALTVSALVVLSALRPKLGTTGLCRWSRMDADGVLGAIDGLDDGEHAAYELVVLSAIAVDKFRSLQRGVDALFFGIVVLAGAVLAGVIL